MSSARFTILLLLALSMVAFTMQLAIEFSSDNVSAACLVLASSMAVLLYIIWTPAIQTHPLSTFALLGFCLTTQLGALLVQSATWTPLTLNLKKPIETFGMLAGFQIIALVAHVAYRFFSISGSQNQPGLIRTWLEKLGLYTTPSVGTVWIMGSIGIVSLLLGGGSVNDGVVEKIFHGMSFVAWAPFLIPMYLQQQGPGYCKAKKNIFFLALYAGLIIVLGMAVNARGMMLAGFMTIALFAMLRAIRSTSPVRSTQLAKMSLIALLLVALTVPVGDLVTAMVIARKARGQISTVQMIENTIYYFQQPKLLDAERERHKFISVQSSYDETYFSSELIGRLIETKFHDNALFFSSRISQKDYEQLLGTSGNFFWSTLPEPFLRALQIDVNKKDLNFSMGDYLSHLAGSGDLGGRKTGSGFAQGLAIFGFVFPLIYLILCPILFLTHDLLAYRSPNGEIWVSALGMLGIWKMFQYGISAESLHHIFMSVVRDLPQSIVLYLLIFYFAGWVAQLLSILTGHESSKQQAMS
jgi:hypothetical protein